MQVSPLRIHRAQLRPILARLECDQVTDIPPAAERFFLEDDPPLVNGAQEVDRRLKRALKKHKVKIERVRRGESAYLGRLYALHDGFVVKIREDVRRSAFRFVVAHELAHTLAYSQVDGRVSRRKPNGKTEEALCTAIARRLLLPDFLLDNDLEAVLGRDSCNLELLDRIAASFDVAPWQVIVRHLESFQRSDVVAVLWAGSSTPLLDDPTDRPPYRVVDSWSMPGLYIPSKDRVFEGGAENSLVWKLDRTNADSIKGMSRFRLGSLQGELDSLCIRPVGRLEHVVQLIFLDEEHKAKAFRWQKKRGLTLQ